VFTSRSLDFKEKKRYFKATILKVLKEENDEEKKLFLFF